MPLQSEATVQRAVLVAAVLVTLLLGATLERRAGRRPVAHLRQRLLLGIPWGTLTASLFVVVVYLFLQGGWAHWYNPVVVPFRAWSYLAPVGMVTAAFGHVGPGHLIGNLVGTLTLAPLAEYAWGHYPRERGTHLFGDLRSNPYARAFLLFPVTVVLVGLGTAWFALGPVIGFSGVVFAFAGFALVYYPIGTVAALTAGSLVRLGYRALREPTLVASGRPAYITPWWADIAIQGHALGLLIGVLLAGALARRRGSGLPRPRRLLIGALLVGVGQNLWAVYWFRGGGEYVLFRAVGLALVFLLALIVAGLSAGGEEDDGEEGDVNSHASRLVPTPTRADGGEQSAGATENDGGESEDDDTEADGETPFDASDDGLLDDALGFQPRAMALVSILLVVAVLAGIAVPTNLFAVGDEELPGDPVEVRGYTVTYAENVENGMVSVVDAEAFGLSTSVNTSGVIVRNPSKNVWTTAVSKGRLAFGGRQTVVVGGIGWRETVTVVRDGYSAVGGPTAYRVTLRHDGESRVAFVSDAARAEPRIEGWNVSVEATETTFRLNLTDGNRSVTAPIPGKNETVRAGGVRFVRDGKAIYAVAGGPDNRTLVKVVTKETYRGN
ncbi:MAG: rhomboid family intramembrane serine protease [Halobaculum sp.]